MSDAPDALIWREGKAGHYLCRHCLDTVERSTSDSIGASYRAAMAHLWSAHSMRRVWIIEKQPERERAVQLALSLAAQHHTSFR